jgi:dolichol-phosphate mannosyltransferase
MKPLYYIQVLGVAIFFITAAMGLFYLVNYFVNPPRNAQGITTIVLLVLGLGSIQIISMSILGDYIGKITEEVKNRPKFIRDRIIYNGKVYDNDVNIMKMIEKIKTENAG